MKLNIILQEFLDKWFLKYDNDNDNETYTNGALEGKVIYEDQEYMVVELTK